MNWRHSILCSATVSLSCLAPFLPVSAQSASVPPTGRGSDSLTAPPAVRVATLTEPGSFSEPGIAIDPHDPARLVAVYQTNAQAVYSHDAGATWTKAQGTAPPNYHISGDVSVTFDNRGHVILCYIAFDKLGTPEYWAHNATRNGIFIRRSPDGGKTWEPGAISVDAIPTAPVIPFEDKPYIVADNTHSPFAGNGADQYFQWLAIDPPTAQPTSSSTIGARIPPTMPLA